MSEAPMMFRELPPTARLKGVVACFWEFAAKESLPTGHLHSVPLDGCVSICYAKMAAGGSRIVFVGPRLKPLQVPVFPGDQFWGVRFLPGASSVAIGKAGGEWRDKSGLLDFEIPAMASRLRELLQNAKELEDTIQAYDETLQIGPTCQPTTAGVYAIASSRGTAKIADIPAAIGISERQFLRLFRREVGLTPKQFARICRLRAAAIDAVKGSSATWGEIAADRGFADQAHLTHEFNELFGLSPSEYESKFLSEIEHGVIH